MLKSKLGCKSQIVRSSQCWVPFTKVIWEISLPLAKGQSARDYVPTMEDFNKILFHAQ